jgi:hypothetical protein
VSGVITFFRPLKNRGKKLPEKGKGREWEGKGVGRGRSGKGREGGGGGRKDIKEGRRKDERKGKRLAACRVQNMESVGIFQYNIFSR